MVESMFKKNQKNKKTTPEFGCRKKCPQQTDQCLGTFLWGGMGEVGEDTTLWFESTEQLCRISSVPTILLGLYILKTGEQKEQ